MSGDLCTVEQAAERLQLHQKTVLRLIHDGRLKAAKIGKSYRIQRSDLDVFAGSVRAEARESPDRVTCSADFGNLSPDTAMRLANLLTAMLNTSETRAEPVRLNAGYDPDLRRLNVIIVGSPADVSALLKTASSVLESWR
jgi:excisionase family DNA binding protein